MYYYYYYYYYYYIIIIILIIIIHEYIYIPTGKSEDLWESHVKRPKVFKCLGTYMSIS